METKEVQFIKAEWNGVCQRLRGWGNKESLFNGYRVSSGEDEVLEMDGGNACTAL